MTLIVAVEGFDTDMSQVALLVRQRRGVAVDRARWSGPTKFSAWRVLRGLLQRRPACPSWELDLSCCSTWANCTSCAVNWLVSSGSSGFWFFQLHG